MAWTIKGGSNGVIANVTKRNMLETLTVTRSGTAFAAIQDGLSWTIETTQTPTGAADYFFYMRNSSQVRDLLLNRIEIDGTVAEIIELQMVTGTPASGSDLTPTNRSVGNNRTFSAVVQGGADITGLSKVGTVEKLFVPAGGSSAKIELIDRPIVLPKQTSAALGIALLAPTGTNALNVLVDVSIQSADVEDLN